MKSFFFLVLAALLLFPGCRNLFNPDGSTDPDDLSANALVEYGEQLLAEKRYSESYSAFDRALNKDSTLSLAYYGQIKATLRIHNVNPLALTKLAATTTDEETGETKKPIEKVADLFESGFFSDLTGYHKMNEIMFEFFRRDSINHYYYLHKNGQEIDPLDTTEVRRYQQFVKSFVRERQRNYSDEQFPLMDEILIRDDLALSYEMSQLLTTMGQVHELMGGGDQFGEDLSALISGDKNLRDLNSFGEAVADSAKGARHNQLVEDIANGTADLDLTADLLGLNKKGENGEEPIDLQHEIDELGEAVLFYKIADLKDNDGDGCADEELYDGIDNDLDGIIDEDVRRTIDDEFDNDRDSTIDNNYERFDPLDTLVNYVKDSLTYPRNFYYNNDSVKILVHLDSNFEVYSLQWRIDSIGGCWK